MTRKVTISVVVCAHTLDRLDSIRETAGSIRNQTYPAHSLTIVCDQSEALFRVLKAELPDVEIIRNEHEKGLSGARNTGIEHSSGEVIAFLDDDAAAAPDWLDKLAIIYNDRSVIAAGGHIEPVWGRKRPGWFPDEFNWVTGCSYTGLPGSRAAVRNLIGCNMSVRRDAALGSGGFRTDLGREGNNAAGCEETEFFIRLKSGYPDKTILYDPLAQVHHQVPPSRCTWKYFLRRCVAEGKSKAQMVRMTGKKSKLTSERSFVFKVLPTGILRNFGQVMRGDLNGLARIANIAAGLVATTAAYCFERVRSGLNKNAETTLFKPVQVIDCELDNNTARLISGRLKTAVSSSGAFCLFRSRGRPVAIEELMLEGSADIEEQVGAFVHRIEKPGGPPVREICESSGGPWVSVVVATRDRPDGLVKCLDSLLAQSYPAMNIIVVDNAPSSNAASDLITSVFAPGGRILYTREDFPGLGSAHNTGLAHALGDVVAFTDDDVIADPDWVAAIASEFAGSSNIGCVTGMILPAELETRAQYWIERHGGFGKGTARQVFDMAGNKSPDRLFPYAAGSFGSGANMAFKRDALVRIGAFDDALGAGTPARGGDDLAAFVEILQTGYQLVYKPDAIIWHHHRRTRAGLGRQAYGYGVGLGAYLTQQVIRNPGKLLHFVRMLPAAVAHLFSPGSSKNRRLSGDFPRHLIWQERMGIIMGIPGYFRSRSRRRTSPHPAVEQPVLASIDPPAE